MIKQYQNTANGDQNQFLFNDPAAATLRAMESIVSNLLKDIQYDEVFNFKKINENANPEISI